MLFGYATGWVVGLVFSAQVLSAFKQAGLTGLSVAELAAILAFIGSFFYAPHRFAR